MDSRLPTRLLLVEDHPGDARLISTYLEASRHFALTHVTRLAQALDHLAADSADLVLLDLGLPDSVGLATLAALLPAAGAAPVLVLTGLDDATSGDLAMAAGAADYLTKSELDERSLTRAVRYALERVRVQRAQQAAERRFTSLFESLTQGVLAQDRHGRFVAVNPAAAELLGRPVAALLGRTFAELGLAFIDSERRPLAAAALANRLLMAEDQVLETLVGLPLADAAPGGVRWLSLRTSRCCGHHPAEAQLHTLLVDVTLERQTAAELAQNDRRLRLLLELLQAPAADVAALLDQSLEAALALTDSAVGFVYNYDEDTQRFTLNSWSREVMDACRVMAPQTTYELHLTGLWGEVVRQRRPMLVNAFERPHPLKRGYPAGHVPLRRFLSVPVFDGQRIVAVVGVGNKSEPYTPTDLLQLSLLMEGVWRGVCRLRAEEERREAVHQLAQAQKMEAVGRLAGGMAHDFNNLLSVIISRVEFGLAALAPDDPIRDDLLEVRLAGDRAATVVRQVLAFSRRAIHEVAPLDLNAVVRDLAKMLRRLVDEDVALVLDLEPEPWAALADRGTLEQAIVNIVVNARDAMPRGGSIALETTNCALDPAAAAGLPGARPGEFVRLTVRDSGEGMDAATLARAFEPFFTTKPVGRGTGLGLATVRDALARVQGFVTAASAPGEGATFTLYLPRGEALEASSTTRRRLARPSGQPLGGAVLVVECDGAVRAVTERILAEAGFTVTAVGRPAEALVACERAPGPFDLLLCDVVLPAMAGPDLAARVKVLHPQVAVLFVSGSADETLLAHGLDPLGAPLLAKPFDPATLLARVAERLAERAAPPAPCAGPSPPARAAAPGAGPDRVDEALAHALADALRRARFAAAEEALDQLALDAPRFAAAVRPMVERFDYEGALAHLRALAPAPPPEAP